MQKYSFDAAQMQEAAIHNTIFMGWGSAFFALLTLGVVIFLVRVLIAGIKENDPDNCGACIFVFAIILISTVIMWSLTCQAHTMLCTPEYYLYTTQS